MAHSQRGPIRSSKPTGAAALRGGGGSGSFAGGSGSGSFGAGGILQRVLNMGRSQPSQSAARGMLDVVGDENHIDPVC